jgi:stress responsive alpha/beta barrel protein
MYPGNVTALVVCVLSAVSMATVCRAEESNEQDKVLRHAVFFKFKDGTSADDVGKVVAAFEALPKKIDSITDYQAGKNVSPIGFDDGFTHCFLVTFKDEAGRAKYLPHPEHKAFGDGLRPHLDKVFVVDYWGTPEKSRKERELKHALFLKFKDTASAEEIKGVEDAIAKLPSQCDTIKAFEWGKNNSPEKHDEGFTHCYMITFDDEKGLKAYASTPAHRAALEKIMAAAEKGRVLDFWTKEKPARDSK